MVKSIGGTCVIAALALMADPSLHAQQDPFSELNPPVAPLRHDPSWSHPTLPGAEAYRLRSEHLDEDRRVFVVLPRSFESTTRAFPLILVLDGESLLDEVVLASRAFVDAGHMPEAVIVGVENTNRLRDLSPPGVPVSGNDGRGRADVFRRFLFGELGSKLARDMRARGPVYLVGHSSGGLFVNYAAAPWWTRGILALDAPMHLGDGQIAQSLVSAARSADRSEQAAPMRVVSVEAGLGFSDAQWSEIEGAVGRDGHAVRIRLEDESHNSMVWPASYAGLKSLFSDYSTVRDRHLPPIEQLRRFDARFGRDEAVPPPRALLVAAVRDRTSALDVERASELVARLEDAYGPSGETETLRERIRAARSTELVGPSLAELQSTPIASPEEARALLGEWVGTTQMEGATNRTPIRLSVRADGSRVTGSLTIGSAPPRDFEYLKVEGDTVHVGYMNRMNPHGMLLYEGIVDGDVFEGLFVLRGVVFTLPGGRELPITRFRLERRP